MGKKVFLVAVTVITCVIVVALFQFLYHRDNPFGLISPTVFVKSLPERNIKFEDSVDMISPDVDALPSVAVYNGTSRLGLTGKFADRVLMKYKIDILVKQNASKRDYPRSFVVDISGRSTEMAKRLAYELDAPLVDIMPSWEATTSADILVILGEDFR